MNDENWQPWIDRDEPYHLPITEPPCSKCKFWLPVVTYHPHVYDEHQRFRVTLCHSAFMNCSFSCFEPKAES